MNRARVALAVLALVAFHGTARAQGKVTRAPRPIEQPLPTYPESEKAEGRSATVVLRLSLGVDGRVTAVEVVEGASPAFDAAAVETGRKLRFEPAEIDGKPAAVRILYRLKFELKEEKPKVGRIVGRLRERGTKRPIAKARVELDDGRAVTTDDEGRFALDEVAPGPHTLTLSSERFTTLRAEETFEAGKRLDATYDLEVKEAQKPGDDDDYEVVVKAPPLRKEVTSTDVSAAEARRTAGTQGDVLKVVESLPGVARPAAGTASIVVWGAAPDDTRVYVDGVRIPRLYHEGGARSVVSGDLVRSVELSPGGHGPAWGRSLGGVVRVTTLPLDEPRVHGAASLDALDAAAALRVPLTPELSVGGAFRRGHLDRVVDAVAKDDVRDVYPVPRYQDAQLKAAYRVGPRDTLEALGLYARDALDRTVPSVDPAATRSESRRVSFWRGALRYRGTTVDGRESDAVAWIGRDDRSLVATFGGTPVSLVQGTDLAGFRARHRAKVAANLTLEVGVDGEVAQSSVARDGSITRPPREGDPRLFGVPPPAEVGTDAWRTMVASLATYAEADISMLGGRLHVLPGLRLEPYVLGVSRRTPVVGDTPEVGALREETAVAPRLSVRGELSRELELRASWGKLHQAPLAEDASPVFGNPQLPLARATQLVAGAVVRPAEGWAVEVTAFRTEMHDLAVRSRLASPLAAQALVPDGEGEAVGAQWLVRLDRKRGPRGWVAYTLSRSERTDGPGLAARRFDQDQTHVLTALAATDLGRGFALSFRFRYATGAPRTPVIGAYFDAKTGRYEPVLGRPNEERLPAFVQLDLRGEKRFSLGGDTAVEVYLDVLNATAHPNAEEVVYSSRYQSRKYVTGLPILPVLGARLSW